MSGRMSQLLEKQASFKEGGSFHLNLGWILDKVNIYNVDVTRDCKVQCPSPSHLTDSLHIPWFCLSVT